MASSLKKARGRAAPPVAAAQQGPSRFQAFQVATLHRRQLKNAPYNPRVITEDARRRLREVIQRVGLVQPIVWNRRTGQVVGGHQRLRALDSLEGSEDYTLTVAVVDVDEVREKEINVALNAPQVCGDFDLDLLRGVLDSEGFELEAAGFNLADVMKLFGEIPGVERQAERESMQECLRALRAAYEAMHRGLVALDDRRFYSVVVFASNEHRQRVLALMGQKDQKYLDGRLLEGVLRSAQQVSGKAKEPGESAEGHGCHAPDVSEQEHAGGAVRDAIGEHATADNAAAG